MTGIVCVCYIARMEKHTAQSLIDAGYPVVWIANSSDMDVACPFEIWVVNPKKENGDFVTPLGLNFEGPFNGEYWEWKHRVNIFNLPWDKIGPGEKLEVDLRELV